MAGFGKMGIVTTALLAGGLIPWSAPSFAQDAPAGAVAAAAVQPAGAPVTVAPNEGESLAAFFARVAQSQPDALATTVSATPASLVEAIRFALDTTTDSVASASVTKGIVQAATANPVAFARQVSNAVVADSQNTPAMISIARAALSNLLSEVIGEGLAQAFSTLRSQGDAVASAYIQAQATGRTAPTVLAETFMDNIGGTAAAAPAANGASGAGGGDIANNAGTLNVGGGVGGAAQNESESGGSTQQAGATAPTRRVSTSAGATYTVETSPVVR